MENGRRLNNKSIVRYRKEIQSMAPSLKAAVRKLTSLSLQGERVTALYFSNEDVILDFEEKLWGRFQLVFKKCSKIEVGCRQMPALWVHDSWLLLDEKTLQLKMFFSQVPISVQIEEAHQFPDLEEVSFSFLEVEINWKLADRGYLKTLENQFATDAMLSGQPFDYGALFRCAAATVRDKRMHCGSKRLRHSERDLILLEDFVMVQMNEIFHGRKALKSCHLVPKSQLIPVSKWQRLKMMIQGAGPVALAELVDATDEAFLKYEWGSDAWKQAFEVIAKRFESAFGEFGIYSDTIFEAFCRYAMNHYQGKPIDQKRCENEVIN